MTAVMQSEFWKNFNLGTEIDIAGTFIYNGLRRLHEMETLYHESDVFEVLATEYLQCFGSEDKKLVPLPVKELAVAGKDR